MTKGVIDHVVQVQVAFRLVTDTPGERMTPQRIDELRRKGMTQNQVAKFFGVSRQAVSKMKHRYGNFTETPRERILRNYPFQHGGEHNQSVLFRRLKEHGLYIAGGAWALSKAQRRDLNRFYHRLRSQSLIVEYDPNTLPSPGNKYGGYSLVPRTKDDNPNSLVRKNTHTTITEEAERFGFWNFPPEDPPA